jgi:hypothetical protein
MKNEEMQRSRHATDPNSLAQRLDNLPFLCPDQPQ